MTLCRARQIGLILLLCSAALFAGSAAQTPPDRDLVFSHKEHLSRAGTSCLTCHAPVAKSREASDHNLPGEETCLVCHDGKRAPKDCTLCHSNPRSVRNRPASKRTFRFNHEYHLGLGNVAPVLDSAITGGRYLGAIEGMRQHLTTDNACLACHRGILQADLATEAHLPRMADCLVCHTRIDPPFSCKYCHTPEAELKPPSHTERFADSHSDRRLVPDKSSCKVCHGVKFTCMGCH